jgi:hypothetical protein
MDKCDATDTQAESLRYPNPGQRSGAAICTAPLPGCRPGIKVRDQNSIPGFQPDVESYGSFLGAMPQAAISEPFRLYTMWRQIT